MIPPNAQTIYKFTDQSMQTRNGHQWDLMVPQEDTCANGLCARGCLHAYRHPLLAVLFNRIYGDIQKPRLFEGLGVVALDDGTKLGCTWLRLDKEIEVPQFPLVAKVRCAILCSLELEQANEYVEWANAWLNGSDRSATAAKDTAWDAARAAWAAAKDAAWAAAWAARAAWAAAKDAAWAAAWAARAVAWAASKQIDILTLAQRAIREEAEYPSRRRAEDESADE